MMTQWKIHKEFFPTTLLLLVSTRHQSLGEFSTAFKQFFGVLKRVVRGVFFKHLFRGRVGSHYRLEELRRPPTSPPENSSGLKPHARRLYSAPQFQAKYTSAARVGAWGDCSGSDLFLWCRPNPTSPSVYLVSLFGTWIYCFWWFLCPTALFT